MNKRLITVSLGCAILFGMGDGNVYSRSLWNSIKFSWKKWRNSFPYNNELEFFNTLDPVELNMTGNPDLVARFEQFKEAESQLDASAESGVNQDTIDAQVQALRSLRRAMQADIEKAYPKGNFWSFYELVQANRDSKKAVVK